MLICELYGARGKSLVCETWCDNVISHSLSSFPGLAPGRDGVRGGVEWMVDASLEKVEEHDDMGR